MHPETLRAGPGAISYEEPARPGMVPDAALGGDGASANFVGIFSARANRRRSQIIAMVSTIRPAIVK